MKALQSGETHKYLGIEQGRRTETGIVKERLKEEFEKRLNPICGTGLNGKNIIKAINTCATPVLVYSFGVMHWNDTEMEELRRIMRKVLKNNRYHHPKAAVGRTLIARKEGNKGVIDVMELKDRQVHNMRKYFHSKTEGNEFMQEIVRADKNLTPLNPSQKEEQLMRTITRRREDRVERWKSKALHDRFFKELNDDGVDKRMSCEWLRTGNLYAETAGFVIAIQDKVVPTRNYRKII